VTGLRFLSHSCRLRSCAVAGTFRQSAGSRCSASAASQAKVSDDWQPRCAPRTLRHASCFTYRFNLKLRMNTAPQTTSTRQAGGARVSSRDFRPRCLLPCGWACGSGVRAESVLNIKLTTGCYAVASYTVKFNMTNRITAAMFPADDVS